MRLPLVRSKTQLSRLLTIEDPFQETIYDVVGRMEVVLSLFESQVTYHHLIPFLKTYYLVTKATAEKYILYKHYFSNLKDIEILDVYFAMLYFHPLLEYLEKGKCSQPWYQYFNYCTQADSLPMLQILLGINAHINTDLYSSLVQLKYSHEADFLLINKILQEIAPKVILFLAKEHDLIGLGGLAFSDFMNSEFQEVIVRWRKDAWENAQNTTRVNQEKLYKEVVSRTEIIAISMIQDFTSIYHLRNLPDSIRDINSISARLKT